jgi:glycosyltransferase involved in cell wall biosynthesis
MRVAIDVSPLHSGHKVRGVGFYLEYLKRSLLEYYPENEYIFFTQREKIDVPVDLIHYPYFDPFFPTLPFVKKTKTVVTVHDLTPLVFAEHFPAGIKGTIRWHLQKYNLRRVDAVIADSNSSKNDIIRLAGVAKEKVTVAYLAAAEEFKMLKKREDIKKKYSLPDKFVLYVGDVTWNKNIPNLIRAVQKIDVPLVMVGKALLDKNFDKENPWNKDLVEAQHLIGRDQFIYLLGFIPTDDLVQLYNQATVAVCPSIYEGFGLPVIQAMQCGCPVVTTHGGSLPEVAGNAALYAESYDNDSIAAAIKEVYFDKNLQDKLSKKGIERAKEFSWKKTADATVKAYKSALGI